MKVNKIDRALFEFLNKNSQRIFIVLIVGFAMLARAIMVPITEYSADYTGCLYPWWMVYKTDGIVGGLGQTIGDYYIPYNLILAFAALFPFQPCYIIACTSILGDLALCYYTYKILILPVFSKYVTKTRAIMVALSMLYLPAVMLNGAFWKQCDSIYSAFILMSMYYLLKEDYNKAFIFFAISFCFKQQAIFFLPFMVIVWVCKQNYSILNFLYLPIAYLICGIPAVLCGRGILETYSCYFAQTQEGDTMSNTTNIYQFGFSSPEVCLIPAMIILCGGYCFAIYWLLKNRDKLSPKKLIAIAAWTMWTCYMFLPKMRQRYDFLALLFVSIFILAFDMRRFWIVIIIHIVSLAQYSRYLFKFDTPILTITVPYVLAYFAFSFYLIKSIISQPVEEKQ